MTAFPAITGGKCIICKKYTDTLIKTKGRYICFTCKKKLANKHVIEK